MNRTDDRYESSLFMNSVNMINVQNRDSRVKGIVYFLVFLVQGTHKSSFFCGLPLPFMPIFCVFA